MADALCWLSSHDAHAAIVACARSFTAAAMATVHRIPLDSREEGERKRNQSFFAQSGKIHL